MCVRRTIHPQYVETFWYDKVRVCQIQQQHEKNPTTGDYQIEVCHLRPLLYPSWKMIM